MYTEELTMCVKTTGHTGGFHSRPLVLEPTNVWVCVFNPFNEPCLVLIVHSLTLKSLLLLLSSKKSTNWRAVRITLMLLVRAPLLLDQSDPKQQHPGKLAGENARRRPGLHGARGSLHGP